MDKFVVKSSENKYWKDGFPEWVSQLQHCTILSENDASDKVNELELGTEFNFRVYCAIERKND